MTEQNTVDRLCQWCLLHDCLADRVAAPLLIDRNFNWDLLKLFSHQDKSKKEFVAFCHVKSFGFKDEFQTLLWIGERFISSLKWRRNSKTLLQLGEGSSSKNCWSATLLVHFGCQCCLVESCCQISSWWQCCAESHTPCC